MSLKRFCDKCGAEVDDRNACEKLKEHDLEIVIGYLHPTVYDDETIESMHYIDLCDTCRKKLENVIRRNLAECLPAPRKHKSKSGKDEK